MVSRVQTEFRLRLRARTDGATAFVEKDVATFWLRVIALGAGWLVQG